MFWIQKKLTLPVLIIRGDADIFLSAAVCKKFHEEMPDSRLIRIPAGGHFIQEDEPEMLLRHIKQFVEENCNDH